MRLSDLIAEFLMEAVSDAGGAVEVRRADLAEQFGCVPSQINYVISTRFSPEQGFVVESRRGGGGYIRIRRVQHSGGTVLMHTVNMIGNAIDYASLCAIVRNLSDYGLLDEGETQLIVAVTGDQALRDVPQSARNTIRARILKHALAALTQE
ncbi:CtsR family transcriptional regulator [Oscillospiraceae bacterium OttesenSCG-928-F05]|nr:CtsR family transcriptional regulator [Oscillospiraceae bacterium OttesenSCG-928-F05]